MYRGIKERRIWLTDFSFFYRKKAEQAEAREAIKAEKAQATSQGGALGQTGGPANPVDNATQGGGNYPNSSY